MVGAERYRTFRFSAAYEKWGKLLRIAQNTLVDKLGASQ